MYVLSYLRDNQSTHLYVRKVLLHNSTELFQYVNYCELRIPTFVTHEFEYKEVLMFFFHFTHMIGAKLGAGGYAFGGGIEITFTAYYYSGDDEKSTVQYWIDNNIQKVEVEETCLDDRPNHINGQTYPFTVKAKAQLCLLYCFDVASGYLYPLGGFSLFGIDL